MCIPRMSSVPCGATHAGAGDSARDKRATPAGLGLARCSMTACRGIGCAVTAFVAPRLPQHLLGRLPCLYHLPLRSHEFLDRHAHVRIVGRHRSPRSPTSCPPRAVALSICCPSSLLSKADLPSRRCRHFPFLLCHRSSPRGSMIQDGMIIAGRQTVNKRLAGICSECGVEFTAPEVSEGITLGTPGLR